MIKHWKSGNQEESLGIVQFATEYDIAKVFTEFNDSKSIIYRWQKEIFGKSENDELQYLK
jgi:hypothetical protein